MRWVALLPLLLVPNPAQANPWQGFTAAAFSPDSRWIVTGGREGEVILWQTSGGEAQQRWQIPNRVSVIGLSFSPSGTIGALCLDGSVWIAQQGQTEVRGAAKADPAWVGLLEQREQWIRSAPLVLGATLVQGSWEVVGTPDGKIVARTEVGKPPRQWQAHSGVITALALTPDRQRLLSCSIDGSMALWDPQTGKLQGRL